MCLPVLVVILEVVETRVAVRVLEAPVGEHMLGIVQDELLRVDVLQEPGEGLAAVLLLELEPSLQAPCGKNRYLVTCKQYLDI